MRKAKKSKKAIKRGRKKRKMKPFHGTERKEDRDTRKKKLQEKGEYNAHDTEAPPPPRKNAKLKFCIFGELCKTNCKYGCFVSISEKL